VRRRTNGADAIVDLDFELDGVDCVDIGGAALRRSALRSGSTKRRDRWRPTVGGSGPIWAIATAGGRGDELGD
jgi:hypothetical protein